MSKLLASYVTILYKIAAPPKERQQSVKKTVRAGTGIGPTPTSSIPDSQGTGIGPTPTSSIPDSQGTGIGPTPTSSIPDSQGTGIGPTPTSSIPDSYKTIQCN